MNKQRQQRLWTAFRQWNFLVALFYGQRLLSNGVQGRSLFGLETTVYALSGGTFVLVLMKCLDWWTWRRGTK